MSRIGKLPVLIPSWVEAKITDSQILVKGPKGSLTFDFVSTAVTVKVVEENVVVEPLSSDESALWWTTRARINNMVEGVTNWYKKSLEINWVGYKFEIQGKKIILSVWFSHKVEVEVPAGIEAVIDEKQKNVMHISGIDKQAVGQFAALIRWYKKPEPYKGKWIKYVGEHIIRKAWKTGK